MGVGWMATTVARFVEGRMPMMRDCDIVNRHSQAIWVIWREPDIQRCAWRLTTLFTLDHGAAKVWTSAHNLFPEAAQMFSPELAARFPWATLVFKDVQNAVLVPCADGVWRHARIPAIPKMFVMAREGGSAKGPVQECYLPQTRDPFARLVRWGDWLTPTTVYLEKRGTAMLEAWFRHQTAARWRLQFEAFAESLAGRALPQEILEVVEGFVVGTVDWPGWVPVWFCGPGLFKEIEFVRRGAWSEVRFQDEARIRRLVDLAVAHEMH